MWPGLKREEGVEGGGGCCPYCGDCGEDGEADDDEVEWWWYQCQWCAEIMRILSAAFSCSFWAARLRSTRLIDET